MARSTARSSKRSHNPPHLPPLAWLRDWCGVDLPARAPIARAFKRTAGVSTNDKESLSLYARLGVEWLAATHQSPIVRGQAAQWITMMQSALRAEQAGACVINSVTTHSFDGADFTIIVLSVLLDKNPDPSKYPPSARSGRRGRASTSWCLLQAPSSRRCAHLSMALRE